MYEQRTEDLATLERYAMIAESIEVNPKLTEVYNWVNIAAELRAIVKRFSK